MELELFAIGLLLSLAFAGVTGVTAGVIIVPAYMVFFLDQPGRLAGIFVAAFVAYGVVANVFKLELKKLIVSACNRDTPPESIGDDDSLIGSDSALSLDSLDVLQVNVAIGQRYGVRIDDSNMRGG